MQNLSDIIDQVATRTAQDRDIADQCVRAALDSIKDAVAEGQKVGLRNFGVFESVAHAAKQGRNPKTGEALTIPARRVPKFRAAAAWKNALS
jgi:DNA-binding protein HU-beta